MKLIDLEPNRPVDNATKFDKALPPTWKQNPHEGSMRPYPVYEEPKLDGVRMMLHITPDGIAATTRNRLPKTGEFNRIEQKLQHFVQDPYLQLYGKEGYTILDGELVAGSLQNTTAIVNALPDYATALQDRNGVAQFNVFDVPYHEGADIRNLPYYDRRLLLDTKVPKFDNIFPVVQRTYYWENAGTWKSDMDVAMEHFAYEGYVYKDPRGTYENGVWLRVKKHMSYDCLVIGYEEGKGKYKGQVGSLQLGMWNTNTWDIQDMGNVAPGTDAERLAISERLWGQTQSAIISMRIVVEVESQQFGAQGKFRHPRLKAYRIDKNAKYDAVPEEVA